MRRFFAPPARFQGHVVTLDREETFHLTRVLRLGVGARVEVCDGQGRNFEAVVSGLDSRQAVLTVVQEREPWGESPLQLVLGIGLAKGEALDEVIRQATEMGVAQIIPFLSERSERLSQDRVSRRLSRWRRLARESLKSCQRSCLPRIVAPQEFAAVLAGDEEARLLFWEEERPGGLASRLARPRPGGVRVLIGPEGGLSAPEAAQAREAGFTVVSLGPRRLKVASAALAALTLIQFAWGDLA